MATNEGSEPGRIRVLGIAGSLRSGSYNWALLRVAQDRAPDSMRITTFDLDEIPPYNLDVEQQGDPDPVVRFKEAISEADALLIATPEYQHGISGVLKNALDWASRPPGESPLNGKTAAIMGATPGMGGTARAQEQLRQTLTYNRVYAVLQPEVLVFRAHQKFDDEGQLIDEDTGKFVSQLLDELVDLTQRLSPT